MSTFIFSIWLNNDGFQYKTPDIKQQINVIKSFWKYKIAWAITFNLVNRKHNFFWSLKKTLSAMYDNLGDP